MQRTPSVHDRRGDNLITERRRRRKRIRQRRARTIDHHHHPRYRSRLLRTVPVNLRSRPLPARAGRLSRAPGKRIDVRQVRQAAAADLALCDQSSSSRRSGRRHRDQRPTTAPRLAQGTTLPPPVWGHDRQREITDVPDRRARRSRRTAGTR